MFNISTTDKHNTNQHKSLCHLILLFSIICFPLAVSAAIPGLPFTEDFNDSDLKDISKTTANWSVKQNSLIQSLRNAQSGGLTSLTVGSDISGDIYTSKSMAVDDIDGDGDMDVIVASQSGSIRYYLNNGSTNPFENVVGVVIASPGLRTAEIAIGDIDSDGDIDLVVARHGYTTNYPDVDPAPNYIFLNNGSSSPFNGSVAIPISNDSYPSTSIVLADMNADGHLDIVSGTSNDVNRIYINNQTSTPFTGAGSNISNDVNNSTDIAVADFNNDGLPDVAVVNNRDSSNNLSVSKYYINDGVGDLFDTSISNDLGTFTFSGDDPSIEVGDLDSDGDIDIAGVGNVSIIYFNEGGADPFPAETYITSYPHPRALGVDLGDVDSDGDIDIVIGTYSGERNKLYLNNGTASPFSGVTSIDLTADSLDTRNILLHDMDNDGDLDLVAANYGGINRLYLNEHSNNPFNSLPGEGVTTDESDTNEIIFVDIDQDGDQDIVTANWNADKLYLNNGTSDPFNGVSAINISTYVDAASPYGIAYSVVAEDFDNDGDIDLAFGESFARVNRLYLNDGTSTPFAANPDQYQEIGIALYDTNHTVSLTAGDIDNDGDIDLIASNTNTSTTNGVDTRNNKLYLNNGSATPFTSAGIIIDSGNADTDQTYAGVLVDINNDGYLDYVAGNSNAASKVYINNKTSNPFNGVSSSYVGSGLSETTVSLRVGDLNSDGLVDVVVANSSQDNRYYLNNGTNTPFQNVTPGTFLESANQSKDSVIEDIDMDGDLDVLFANVGHNFLYLNNGTSDPFNSVQPIEISSDVGTFESIAVADVDNDGDKDLLSATFGVNSIYYNQSASEAFIAIRENTIESTAESTWAIAIADMDNDGDLDVVHGNRYIQNKLYLNNGSAFSNTSGSDITSDNHSTYDIAVADMNHDGLKDVVVANDGQNYLYLNDGVGDLFDTAVALPIGSETDTSWSIDIADINQDGHPDVVVGNASNVNRYYLNTGTSNPFNGVTAKTIDGLDSHTTYGIKAVDIDLDGDIDIIALNNSSSTNRLYLNSGGATPYANGSGIDITGDSSNSYEAAIGDVNGDGLPDLVVANFTSATNRLYLNDGIGNPFDAIAGTNISNDAFSTISIALMDIDHDGDLDVITPNYTGADTYYLNDGSSGNPFASATGVLLASSPTPTYQAWDVAIGDIDGDGNDDIVVANSGAANRVIRSLPYDNTRNKAASLEVDTDSDILHATLTPTVSIPNLTGISWYMSNDGGQKYYIVKPGVEFTFPQPGDDLRWKAELHSLSPLVTPIVNSINITARFDHDQDLVADDIDICVGTYDPDQIDSDNDGTRGDSPNPNTSLVGGDACDIDDDNDGIADVYDLFPFNPDESADTDGDCGAIDYNLPTSGSDPDGAGPLDGCGDTSDPDKDGDGILNASDPFMFNVAPRISGTPSTTATPKALYLFTPTEVTDGEGNGTEVISINQTLPAWLTFNTSTGVLTGVPSNDDYGTISNIIITVADAYETATLGPFNIEVIDTRAPTTVAVPGGGNFNDDANVNIACFETIGSGCASIYYSIDGAAFVRVDSTSTLVTIPSSLGNTNLRFYSVDNDGNSEFANLKTETYNFDLTYPVVSISTPVDGSILTSVTSIDGSSSDTGTGIASVAIQITDGTNSVQTPGSSLVVGTPAWLPVSASAGVWTYDTSGLNWSIEATYTITARAIDGAGNTVNTNVSYTYFSGTASATTLTTSLTSASIPNGENTDAIVTLTMLNNPSADLTGVPVELHITKPDNSTVILNGNTNFSGNLTFSQLGDGSLITFTDPGQYQMVAKFTDTTTYPNMAASTSSSVNLLVGSSAGYAVIVQGKLSNNDGLESHNKTANRIYETLKDRGFVDGDIYYFNYNTNQPGVDGLPDKTTIQSTIEGLAAEVDNRPAPVYIIFVDHGGKATNSLSARFFIDNETITPTELDSWLGTLEANMDALDLQLAINNPRVVIIGACYSGGFISDLSGSGRIIMTSATENEQSFKGPLEDDNIRVGEYFLEELFLEMGNGNNLRESFKVATAKTETYTKGASGDVSTNSDNEFLDTAVQHPLLDDDGNAAGTNTIYENTDDGQIAKDIILGFDQDSLTNDAFIPAEVTSIGGTQSLADGVDTANLTLYANDPFQVNQAYIEIRSPDITLASAVENTTEQLTSNFVRRAFTPPVTEGAPYTLSYDNFSQPGKYEIYYYVNDRFTGALSPAKRGILYRNRPAGGDVNDAPVWSSGDLLTPLNGATGFTTTSFDWEDAIDPDSDVISYNFILADDSGFNSFSQANDDGTCSVTNAAYRQEELTSSSTFVDSQARLCDSHAYVWKVEAVDAYGLVTGSSNTFSYNTNDTNADIGVIVAMVKSSSTNQRLTAANIFNDKGDVGVSSASVLYNGNYVLFTQSTSVVQILSASKAGFATANIPNITVGSGETKEFLLSLDPDPSTDTDGDGINDGVDNCPNIANPLVLGVQPDNDGDAQGDACDTDDDNDGISDVYENLYAFLDPFNDTDAALDEDGDNISNLDEYRNGTDPGVFNLVPSDIDGDGIDDSVDNCVTDYNPNQLNTDGDSLGNVCDPDDDGDGMSDDYETFYGLDPLVNDASADSDGDGISNFDEFTNKTNPAVKNTETIDTDLDGVVDVTDNCPSIANGIAQDNQLDTDGDSVGDACDSDDDNDSVPDSSDAFPLDPAESADFDNDGIGDNADNDDDNDGMSDAFELLYGLNPKDNSDAIGDADSDGVLNINEFTNGTNPLVANTDTIDTDLDGVVDVTDNCPSTANGVAEDNQLDTDGDSVGDACDADDDNDGAPDSSDAFPLDATESADFDGDGTGDNADNDDDEDGMSDAFELLYSLNPKDNSDATLDADSDGISNLAEFTNGTNPRVANSETIDTDLDGVVDVIDNCPVIANGINEDNQLDTDGDSVGDACDSDDDNDGVADSADLFPLDASESADADGDGTGDNADTDDDNDGMTDTFELLYSLDPFNPSDAADDPDGDNLTNLQEFQNGTSPNSSNVVAAAAAGGILNLWALLVFTGLIVARRRAAIKGESSTGRR